MLRVTSLVSLARALDATADRDGGKPRLTWYGPGGEYSDVSSSVFRQWVAKSGNFLVEELDVEPGGNVAVVLPVHWTSIVLVTAISAVGAVASDDVPTADAVVSVHPLDPRPPVNVAGVNVAPLARSMPAGDTWWDSDFIHDVRACADSAMYEVQTPTTAVSSTAERVLVDVRTGDVSKPAPVTHLLDLATQVWQGHSLVLVADPAADIERVSAQEQVTSTSQVL